jgi:drug/metabolite transporter (DMT)-like permease
MRAVYADGGNASFVILIATAARAIPLFLTCLLQRRPLFSTKQDRRNALTGGIFQVFSSVGLLTAVSYLPGPVVIVILFTHTLMLLGFMIWRGDVKADAATLLTTLSALIGLGFVLDLMHQQTHANLIGMGLAFTAAIAVATRLYVYGHQMKTQHPAVVGAENFIVANFFMPLILFYQLPVSPHSTAGYWWMALGCFTLGMGTFGQFYAIKLLGSFRFSLFLKLEPMFATIFAALLIGDILKPMQYCGIVLVIGSLALYQVIDHHRRKSADLILNAPPD